MNSTQAETIMAQEMGKQTGQDKAEKDQERSGDMMGWDDGGGEWLVVGL